MKRPQITYLVSGDENIEPCDQTLRDSGRRVRHGPQVTGPAAHELPNGTRAVIVAHGNEDGTVFWSQGADDVTKPWLWVRMKRPPQGSRIYLYACHAGRKLPESLPRCECFGHTNAVPMPSDGADKVVLAFLDRVDALMASGSFDRDRWRSQLLSYLDEAWVDELENPSDEMRTSYILHLLRRSLGYSDV